MGERKRKGRSWLRRVLGVIAALIVLPVLGSVAGVLGRDYDWRTAPRYSIGIAPDPATTPEAVVQVYTARTFSWRGAFGVHSWIAVKPTGAPAFTVYEVIGWRAMHGLSALSRSQRAPDGLWYGNRPEIVADLRGPNVDRVIAHIERAVATYPYLDSYTIWPGPNSNTFTAFVAREVPELRLDLPPTAIGKDYLPNGDLVARAPSGTGWQVSLFGLLGVLVAVDEGFELNILGLTLGIDFAHPALKLPGIGRIGFPVRSG
ncbi:MAG: DUF3750 domain-containing protein [Alphaproteobacteria bacterium]